MESLVMNYSDEEYEFPSEDRAASNHFTSRTPNSVYNALQEIREIPDCPKNILETFWLPVVVRSSRDLKDAANNTNESARNQIEDDDNMVLISDEEDSNCDSNINNGISSIIISNVETVVDDHDYVALCKSSVKAALPISNTSFVGHGVNMETAMDFDNISDKECEGSDRENSAVATLPISASSTIRDSDNSENPSVSPINSAKEDQDSPNSTAVTLPISTRSLVDYGAASDNSDKEYEIVDKENSVAVTSLLASSPSIRHRTRTKTANSDRVVEKSDKENSTAVTSRILSTRLVGHRADTETAMDSDSSEDYSVSPVSTDEEVEKNDKDNSTGATLTVSIRSLVGHAADKEKAMDSDYSENHSKSSNDEEGKESDKENSTEVVKNGLDEPSGRQGEISKQFGANSRDTSGDSQKSQGKPSTISDRITFKCKLCSYSSTVRFALKRHMLTHLENSYLNKIKCELCPFEAKSKKSLSNHWLVTHRNEKSKCTICDMFVPAVLKEKHLLKCKTKTKVFQCKVCQYKTIYERMIARHEMKCSQWRSIPRQSEASEDRCQKLEKSKQRGETNEPSKKLHRCEYCSYSTKEKSRFNKHIRAHTVSNSPIYRCPECDYKSTRQSLTYHMKMIHKMKLRYHSLSATKTGNFGTYTTTNEDYYYTCKFCSFTTKKGSHLKRHLLLHTVHNRPIYHCPKCDYKSIKMNLKKHLKTVHKIQFIDTNVLIRTEGSKQCDTKAPKIALNVCHKADIESQDNPSQLTKTEYTCKFCSFTTKKGSDLKRHLLLHTVHNRPIYHCPKCDYKSTKINLQKHLKTVHKSQFIHTNVLKRTEGSKPCDTKAPKIALNVCYKAGIESQDNPSQLTKTEYTCKFCSFTSHYGCHLRRHTLLHTVHNKPLYHCQKCDYKAPRFTLLFHHKNYHGSRMDKKVYTCKFCSHTTKKECHLEAHLLLHTAHNRPIYNCPKCDYKSTKRSLEKHVKTVHKIQSISKNSFKKRGGSKRCDTKAPQIALNFYHKSASESQKDDPGQLTKTEYTCKLCSHTTNKGSHLKRHLLLHTNHNIPIYRCPKCDYKNTKRSLEEHVKTVHKIQPIGTIFSDGSKRCDTKAPQIALNFQYKGASESQKDNLSQLTKTQYTCKFCSFTAYDGRSLRKHTRLHTLHNRPLYHCQKCDFKAPRLTLFFHYKNFHGSLMDKQVYFCKFCSHTTKKEIHLAKHLLLHTVHNRPIYLCPKCDYKSTKMNLEKHVKTVHKIQFIGTEFFKKAEGSKRCDSKEPQIALNFQYKGASESQNDNPGQLTKTEYPCKFCSHATKRESDLKEHLLLHTVHHRPIYHCPKCDYTSTKMNLQKHVKTVHKIQINGTDFFKKTEGSKQCDTKAPQIALNFPSRGASESQKDNPGQLTKTEYPCKFCSHATKRESDLKEHLLLHTVHHRPIYHCPKCDYTSTKMNLQKHVKTVHKIQINGTDFFKKTEGSKQCDTKAPQIALNFSHRGASESQKDNPGQLTKTEYPCKFCSHATKREGHLKEHLLLHTVHNRPIYLCPKCDYKSTRMNLEIHVKTVHKIHINGADFFKKTEGSKQCDTKAPQIALNFHYKGSSESQKDNLGQLTKTEYPCKFCSHATKREGHLKEHLLLHTVHNRPIYHCPKCDYKSTKMNLKNHVNTVHKIQFNGTDFFKKTEGSKRCGTKAPQIALTFHYKGSSESQKDNLGQLTKTEYTCKFCSHVSKRESHLEEHLLLHTVHNRPIYQCPKCDYKSTKRSLETHVKTVHKIQNNGTDLFKKTEGLKQCDTKAPQIALNFPYRGASESQNDNRGQLTKTEYTCKFCSHATKRESDLEKHVLLHTVHNRPIYHCPKCDYKSTKMNLKNHVNTVHKIQFNGTDFFKKTEGSKRCGIKAPQKGSSESQKDNLGQLTKTEYTCKFCSHVSKRESHLEEHLLLHTVHNSPIYQCPKCDYKSTKRSLEKHVKAVHKLQSIIGTNFFKETEASKPCYTKAPQIALNFPSRGASESQKDNPGQLTKTKYKCKFCSFTTKKGSDLKRHLLLHTVHNRPIYHCPKCDYKSTKINLQKHVKTVHKIKSIHTDSLKRTYRKTKSCT